MGEPKQLLPFRGKSLLWQAATTAIETGLEPVIVVLGAHSHVIKKELAGLKLTILENTDWKEGMSTSLKVGESAALKLAPDLDALIFMVCDQPFVSSALLLELLNTRRVSGNSIVASAYEGILGTPALFGRETFLALRELTGDAGARRLIKQFGDQVASVDFPKGHIDIDTKNDYATFIQPE